jgi:hypothetical protein
MPNVQRTVAALPIDLTHLADVALQVAWATKSDTASWTSVEHCQSMLFLAVIKADLAQSDATTKRSCSAGRDG